MLSKGEESLEKALTLANNLTRLWSGADEEHRHKLLRTVFVKFIVDQQRIIDMELKPPYSRLLRLKLNG